MKHPAAFCAGLIATMFVLFPGYLVVLFCYCRAPWYDFRCVLTCLGYVLAALAGGQFGRCVSAYRDEAADVAGYCRPVRQGSAR